MDNIDLTEKNPEESPETEEEKKAEVANILLYCPEDDTVFLMKRSSKVTYPGVWGAPGGHKEQGESLKAAAAREFIEEIGGLPRIKDDLGYLSFRFNDKLIIMYILTVSIEIKKNWTPPRLSPREVSDARWFKRSEIPADTFSTIKESVLKIPFLIRTAMYYNFSYKKGRS